MAIFIFLTIGEKYDPGKKFGRKLLLAKNDVHTLIGGEMWFLAIFIFLTIGEKYDPGKKFGRKLLLAKNDVHALIGGEM